jgi:bifunctional non-homologous end joining protein LigD
MQVYVPLNSAVGFVETKTFARGVAEVLARRLPDRVVARTDKRLRRGRVLVDWGQNDRHKSTVAAHSLRAKRAWPTVSAPVRWEEVRSAVRERSERALLIAPGEALRRADEHGDLFAPVLEVVQRLP